MRLIPGSMLKATNTGYVFTIDAIAASINDKHGLCYTDIRGHWEDGESGSWAGAALARDIQKGLVKQINPYTRE